MSKIKFLSGVIVLVAALMIAAASVSQAADEEMTEVEGTVICLIPDYGNATVKPVVASGPCDQLPPHQHVLVTKDKVYSLQGLQDGLMKIEQSPQRSNVKINGKIEGSDQTAWVLIVQ